MASPQRVSLLLPLLLLLLAAVATVSEARRHGLAHKHVNAAVLPLPTASQLLWAQREFGVIIHFDPSTFSPTANRGFGCTPPSWGTPPLDWKTFAPTNVSVAQWAQAAAAVGAKYAVLAAKHACGFTLWPTKAKLPDGSPYMNHVGNSPYAKDLAAEFIQAFKLAGVAPGFYYSLTQNVYLNEWDGQVYAAAASPFAVNVTEEQLIDIQTQQLTELWTNYGQLSEVWFDGGFPKSMQAMVDKLIALQPAATAFQGYPSSPNPIRWSGTEGGACEYPCWSTSPDGTSSGGGSADGPVWAPAEADFTLQNGDNWFYSATVGLHSLRELVNTYHSTVGHNANLLLDLAIMPSGRLPDDAFALYHTFGDWIRTCYDHPVNRTSGLPLDNTLTISLGTPTAVDRFVIQEDQTFGQRIRTYSISALLNGSWSTVADGSSVGNKRIHLLDSSITTAQVKLVVTTALGPAAISNFAVHMCERP